MGLLFLAKGKETHRRFYYWKHPRTKGVAATKDSHTQSGLILVFPVRIFFSDSSP